jgi:hypothetical protein
VESDKRGAQQRSHWSQWANWLAGGFAVTANAVGVLEVATAHRLLLSLVAGALAIGGGALWLWRLSGTGQQLRFRRQIFALNLAMVVIGAGLIGAALSGQRLPQTASPSAEGTVDTQSRAPAAAESRPGAPGGQQLFTGTIKFRFPSEGNILTPGHSVSGEVTGWVPGYQVWLPPIPPAGGPRYMAGARWRAPPGNAPECSSLGTPATWSTCSWWSSRTLSPTGSPTAPSWL